jgi:hypothetical protein
VPIEEEEENHYGLSIIDKYFSPNKKYQLYKIKYSLSMNERIQEMKS